MGPWVPNQGRWYQPRRRAGAHHRLDKLSSSARAYFVRNSASSMKRFSKSLSFLIPSPSAFVSLQSPIPPTYGVLEVTNNTASTMRFMFPVLCFNTTAEIFVIPPCATEFRTA